MLGQRLCAPPLRLLPLLVAALVAVCSWSGGVFAAPPSPVVNITDCQGCISFQVFDATNWLDALDMCKGQAYLGTRGTLAILRSNVVREQISSYMLSALAVAYAWVGATDRLSEAIWRWEPTGEHFFTGTGTTNSVPRFASAQWNAMEPNNAGTENYGCIKNGFLDDKQVTAAPVVRAVCMYHHPVIGFTTSQPTFGSATAFGIAQGAKLAEIQLYEEHVTLAVAADRCRRFTRVDANTGRTINGSVAVLRSAAHSNVLRDLLMAQSTIPVHTTLFGFGVWVAGLRTHISNKDAVIAATMSDQTKLHTNAGCDGNAYCNFTVAESWFSTTGAGMMMYALDNNQRWNFQSVTETMPFACSFEHSLAASLNSTTPSLTRDLQRSFATVEIVKYLQFGDHLTWDRARDSCATLTRTNAAGDVATGALAEVLSAGENSAVFGLAHAAGMLGRGTGSDFGVWLGASTFGSDDGTWTFNTSGGRVATVGVCESDVYCNFNPAYLASLDVSGAAAGLVLGLSSPNIAKWVTQRVDTPLPYVCSFHFPYRVNVSKWLTVEMHRPLKSFAAAVATCAGRSVGLGGSSVGGQLYALPAGEGKVLTMLASRLPSNFSALWIGRTHANGSCLAARQGSGVAGSLPALVWLDCGRTLMHLCYFRVNQTTKTRSVSRNATATISAATQISESHSTTRATESATAAASAASRTKSPVESGSASTTGSLRVTRSSESASRADTASASHTASGNRSDSVSLSQSRVVASSSASATAPDSVSRSATQHSASASEGGDTASASSTPSDSQTRSRTNPVLVQAVPAVTAQEFASNVAVFAAFSGAGVVAAQQARLTVASSLVQCGAGDDMAEEPDRLSSPLKLRIGAEPFMWSRGLLVGNVAVLGIVAAAMGLVAGVYALVQEVPLTTGLLRVRMPGILFLPLLVLMPPSADHATRLFWWGQGAPDLMLAIAAASALVFAPCVVAGAVCWASARGRVVLHTRNIEQGRAMATRCPSFARTGLYAAFCYATDARFEYTDAVVLPARRARTAGHDHGDGHGDGALAAELLDRRSVVVQRPADSHNTRDDSGGGGGGAHHASKRGAGGAIAFALANPFIGKWGVLFEDFSLYSFAVVDLLVSAVLGITAGVASGVVGRDTCLVCFCVDIVAASYHLYLLLRYRGVTPRFVCFYSAAASLITLVAVVMALAQWLTKVLELQSSWNVLSLTQAALGVCAALMAGISFVDFMWQLVESFVSRGGGSRETTVAFSVPADAMHDTELLIDIEAELAALPSSAAAGGEPPPPAVGEFDLLAALAELAAGSAMEAPPQEVSVVEQPPPPPDLNALLDDGDGDDNNASGGAYVLDDTEMPVGDDGGVNQRMSVARGNEEMARNLRELARMLGGGHKPKPRDDFF